MVKAAPLTFYTVSPPIPLGMVGPLKTYVSSLGWTPGECVYAGLTQVPQSILSSTRTQKVEPVYSLVISKETDPNEPLHLPEIDFDEAVKLYDSLVKGAN